MLVPLVAVLPCLAFVLALPTTPQIPFNLLESADKNSSTSLSFSRWAKRAKRAFLDDLERDKAHDWVVVMGNEAAVRYPLKAVLCLADDGLRSGHGFDCECISVGVSA